MSDNFVSVTGTTSSVIPGRTKLTLDMPAASSKTTIAPEMPTHRPAKKHAHHGDVTFYEGLPD